MTKKLDIPDPTAMVENCDARPNLELSHYEVAEWGPGRDGKGPSTEVHLRLHMRGLGAVLGLRLKTPDAVDTLIAVLMRHRNSVWGGNGS